MSWLDDLRKDPDGTHRSLVQRLYRQSPVIASFGRVLYRYYDEQRRVVAFVEVGAFAPSVLLPPEILSERPDEIVLVGGETQVRFPFDPSRCILWRHVALLPLTANEHEVSIDPPVTPPLDEEGRHVE